MNQIIRVCDDHEAMSREAARVTLTALVRKRAALVCAAGGSTPLRTYDLLAEHHAREPYALEMMRVLKLDEWGGIAMDDPASCESQMRKHLIGPLRLREDSPVGLQAERYIGFKSDPSDPEAECERIRGWLAVHGPIDVCILGLGQNGHIGMNEPNAALRPYAHVARLAESSLRHPMLANSKNTPAYGLTLGMAEILGSREILLLVSGTSKREPLRRLLRREIATEFPASFVWLHPNWTLLCDRAAAEGLDLKS